MPHDPLDFAQERPNFKEWLEFVEANRHSIALIMDNLLNPRNIGALFRLADAARIEQLYFFGQLPVDGPSINDRVKKAARSTQKYVPYSRIEDLHELARLKGKYHFIALERTDTSVEYLEMDYPGQTALIVGNEQTGISKEVLALCEAAIHIPMYGINTSMNVAMAAAVAVYAILQKKL